MLSLLLAACVAEEPGRGVQDAEAVACLEPPSGTPLDPVALDHLFEVEGTVTGDAAVVDEVFAWGERCDAASRFFTVQDDDGGEWKVGYGWSEGNADATPALQVLPLSPVALTFRLVTDQATAAGFVLREADRVAAAIEVGRWGPALTPDDVEGLRVGEGETTGTEPDPCGTRVARAVRFTADEQIEIEAVGSAPFLLDGLDLLAWAFTSWGWEDATCTDPALAGELSWGLWRPGP